MNQKVELPEDYYTGPAFAVSLVFCLAEEPSEDFKRNCTHVTGRFYIFEGEPMALDGPFEILAEGIVYSLGDLDHEQLIQVCKESFILDYEIDFYNFEQVPIKIINKMIKKIQHLTEENKRLDNHLTEFLY